MPLALPRAAFVLAGLFCESYAWRSKPSAERQHSMRDDETPANFEQLVGQVRSRGSLRELRRVTLLFLASKAAAAFRSTGNPKSGLHHPVRQHCLSRRAPAVRMEAAQQRKRSDCKKEDLDWDRAHRGPEHPLTLSTLISYAAALVEEGHRDKAEPFMKEAVDVTRRVLGLEDPETLRAAELYEKTFGRAATVEGAFFKELPEDEPPLQNSTGQATVEASSDMETSSELELPSLQNSSREVTAEAASELAASATSSNEELPDKQFLPDGTVEVDEDPSSWSLERLLEWLDDRFVDREDCLEKEQLVERVREVLEKEKAAQNQGSPQAAQSKQKATPRPARRDARDFKEFGELVYVDATAPSKQGPCSVIFLHGFADSARGFASNVPGLLRLPEIRFVLPTAMDGGGFAMTSWFDITAMMSAGGMNVGPEVMQNSVDYIHHLIRVEMDRGVPPDRIFLGGFSQGGCTALRAALSFPDGKLGGVFALSTFLGSSASLPVSAANAKLRVLSCHGQADPMVPLAEGARLCSELRAKGIRVEARTYPNLGHASSDEEAEDVRCFLKQRLIAQGGPERLENLTVFELKTLLEELGINTRGCVDKYDMRDRAYPQLFD